MQGVLDAGAGEASAVVAAVRAGCDVLLYPTDLRLVLGALQRSMSRRWHGQAVEPVDRTH